jgi:hypothetical protein
VGPPVFRPGASSIQPAHLLIVGTVAAASAGALIVHGTRPANIVFVVLAIVSTGVAAWAVYRTLWPLASDVGPIQPEMMGGRPRAALEREKAIVLRAITELEFDRAMGKVSQADCEEMIGRLRARAVRLIRQLDAGSAGHRELIERELNARLEAPDRGSQNGRANAPIAAPVGPPGFSPGASSCAVCGAVNDADARFCKACGTKLGVRA